MNYTEQAELMDGEDYAAIGDGTAEVTVSDGRLVVRADVSGLIQAHMEAGTDGADTVAVAIPIGNAERLLADAGRQIPFLQFQVALLKSALRKIHHETEPRPMKIIAETALDESRVQALEYDAASMKEAP